MMSLSVFDDDGLLGDLSLRSFSVRVQGSVHQDVWLLLFPLLAITAHSVESGIRDILNSKGWLIDQVTQVATGWFDTNTYLISGRVGPQYTDAQIRDQMRTDLAGAFEITNYEVVGDPYNGFPVVSSGGSTSQPKSSQTVNYAPGLPAVQNNSASTGASDFLGSFGKGLGLSSPYALLAGGVLLVLLLKR